MSLSLLAAFGLIAIIFLFTYSPADESIKAVDYQPTAAAARSSGAFAVALPVGLPAGYQATSVRYRPSQTDPKVATWHLGFVAPGNQYVELDQSNGTDDGFVKDSTVKGTPDGTQIAAGRTWTRYYSDTAAPPYRSLVSKADGVTTVVTGTLSYDELAIFASSLRND